MSDIHKRDYGRELEKKKSRRTQKHRASQHRLTAKFKKELAGKKRQEQTAESRAAEQAEQSAELLTQEGATRFASGATTLLLHGKKNQIGNEQEFSDNNPSIHPSNQATTAPDETVPWNAKKPADAWRQQAKEEMSKKYRQSTAAADLFLREMDKGQNIVRGQDPLAHQPSPHHRKAADKQQRPSVAAVLPCSANGRSAQQH